VDCSPASVRDIPDLNAAPSITDDSTIEYLTDVEGNWEYFVNFVWKSKILYWEGDPLGVWGPGKLSLRPNGILVFGGDAPDKGPGDIRFIKTLVSVLGSALPPTEDARRLAGGHSQEERNIDIGLCVFDVLQAAMFLARAGSMIQEVVWVCKEAESVEYTYKKEHDVEARGLDVGSLGSVNKIVASLKNKSLKDAQAYLDEAGPHMPHEEEENGRRLGMLGKSPTANITLESVKHAQRVCSVGVLHMLSSFAYVGSFLSFAAAKCPETKSYDAACAGSIINVITSLTIVAASALDFENSCDQVGKNHTGESHSEEIPGARRLREATEALASFVV